MKFIKERFPYWMVPWLRILSILITVIIISLILNRDIEKSNKKDYLSIEEKIIVLPVNTIIKQSYVINKREIYLLEDTIQNVYEKCYLINGELISEIIFIKN